MTGLKITVPGSFWKNAGWATGPALVRKEFIGAASRAFWIDPSDITTLFQDRAGTIPVTGPGDPVSLVLDKSGLGQNMVLHDDATEQPTYESDGFRYWIEVPIGAYFAIPNPIRKDVHSFVAAVRFTGGTHSGGSRYLVYQTGPSAQAFVALQLGRTDGVLAANTDRAGGHELMGSVEILDGQDYILSYQLDTPSTWAGIRVNGSDDGQYHDVESWTQATDQGDLLVFAWASGSSLEVTSGRIYGLAFHWGTMPDVAEVERIFAEKAGVAL